MKNNRKARQILAIDKCPTHYRVSNRRVMMHTTHWPYQWTFETKPSRSQKKAAKINGSLIHKVKVVVNVC